MDNSSLNIKIHSKNYEFLADLETPVSAFYKACKDNPFSFLLESVENNEKIGRFSILGSDPILIFESKNNSSTLKNTENNTIENLNPNPFIALKSLLGQISCEDKSILNFIGFYGYVGFENIRWIEPSTEFENYKKGSDISLMLPGKLIVFDHIERKINLIVLSTKNEINLNEKLNKLSNCFKEEVNLPILNINYKKDSKINYTGNFSKEEYMALVNEAKKYIHSGDIFQIVTSQKLKVTGNFDSLSLYRALRSINPSPYLFYINYGNFKIAGSSPEVMVKCDLIGENRIASVRPIAGTYPRGKNEKEDKANIKSLSEDKKEIAEHLMLVDLARNDLGRVCEYGSINVPELMVIEKYSHVFHMVSLVQGILKKDKTSIDLLAACFPHGTLSGAPKVRAMQLIKQFEKEQRGPYGGCLGFFGINNTINTCMTIRTFIIRNNEVEIQAGGGIVADSDPENEYMETIRKGSALLKAISLIQK